MSQTVDVKDLPKMKMEKKEIEIANLFSDAPTDPGQVTTTAQFSDLHDVMGFMP